MATFNEGDVVMLKSGGPSMTVDGYSDNGKVICVWFESNKREESLFNENTLEKFEENAVSGHVETFQEWVELLFPVCFSLLSKEKRLLGTDTRIMEISTMF